MSRESSTPRFMSDRAPGCHRGDFLRSTAAAEQAPLPFNARAQLEADQTHMRRLFAETARKFGGVPALTESLGRDEAYEKKISGAINNEKDRKVQLDWLAAMLDDPAIIDFVDWLNERTGHEPPVRKRVISTLETQETVTEVVAEMDQIVREGVRREVARRRGVRVEDVKL